LSQRELGFSGAVAQFGGAAGDPLKSDIGTFAVGAMWPELYQSSMFERASPSLMNQRAFRHSARNLPLNDSM